MDYYHIGIVVFKYKEESGKDIEYTVTSYLKDDKSINTQMEEMEEMYKPKCEYKIDSRVITLPTKVRWIDRIRFSAERLCNIRGQKLEMVEEYQCGYMEGYQDGKVKAYFWDSLGIIIFAILVLLSI